MSYRRALLGRWSGQDWLAVAVVALAVAFLTGTGLAVDAAATRTTEIAAGQENPARATWYDSPGAARRAAGDGAVVLPVARVRVNGTRATVVGVPPGAATFGDRTGVPLPARPPPGVVTRGGRARGTVRLAGDTGVVTVEVRPRGRSALPKRWYAARPETVRRLGTSGALVLEPGDGADSGGDAGSANALDDRSVPLVGALSFFLAGARSALRLVGLVAAGAGVLLGVAVFGVTRVAVRERSRTIRAVRATGGPPRTVLSLFAARAGLQTAVGVALGYAVGVVATNAAVSAAVFAGQPVALAPRVSGRLVRLLVPSYVALVGVGAVGGTLAARPAVRTPPAAVTDPVAPPSDDDGPLGWLSAGDGPLGRLSKGDATPGRLPSGNALLGRLRPTLLDWRAAVPTAATLSVFVAVVVVAAAGYAVVAPLAAGQGATVTEPGAAHPVASQVPVSYAEALRARGVAASPEILLLSVRDGQPFVARGANFSAFARLSDAHVVRGRAPAGPGEAVVGVDLARTLDVEVGERITLGGSTAAAVTRVRVVGVYAAREPFDDQLVVPLPTARHLSGVPPGTANLIRVGELPDTRSRPSVVAVDAPREVATGESFAASVTLVNPTASERTRTLRFAFGDQRRTRTVTLAPGERRTLTVSFDAGSARTAMLSVAGRTRTVRVIPPDALRIEGLPAEAPPGSEPVVGVATATGTPVANATVVVGGERRRTDAEGRVRVPLPERVDGARTVTVRAVAGDRATNATVRVAPDVRRRLLASVTVAPSRPTVVTRPRATVRLRNPWNRTLARTVVVEGPGGTRERRVRLAPGENATVSVRLPRRPPGAYEVAVRATDGGRSATLATARYRVVGDTRLAAALAATGRDAPATGIGQAATVLFGNLELLVAVLLLLAGLMTAGATTASFAGAVHARRRTLGVHRAVGATPGAVLRLVVADAVVVGAAATLLALALAGAALAAVDAAGLLTVYGVRLLSTVSPLAVAGAATGAFLLAVLGAAAAAWGVVRAPPTRLLADGRRGQRPAGDAGDPYTTSGDPQRPAGAADDPRTGGDSATDRGEEDA